MASAKTSGLAGTGLVASRGARGIAKSRRRRAMNASTAVGSSRALKPRERMYATPAKQPAMKRTLSRYLKRILFTNDPAILMLMHHLHMRADIPNGPQV